MDSYPHGVLPAEFTLLYLDATLQKNILTEADDKEDISSASRFHVSNVTHHSSGKVNLKHP